MITVANKEAISRNKGLDVINRCRALRGVLNSLEVLMTPRGHILIDKGAVKALKEIVNAHIMEINDELNDLLDQNDLTYTGSQFYQEPGRFICKDDDKLI